MSPTRPRRRALTLIPALAVVGGVLAGCANTPAPAKAVPADQVACAELHAIAHGGLYTASTPAAKRALATELSAAAAHTPGATQRALQSLALVVRAEAASPKTLLTPAQLAALSTGAQTVATFAITACHVQFPTPPAGISTPAASTPSGTSGTSVSGTGTS